jgi:solute carrier family 25 carnitine/acylcarnitine transporter 20/29
MERPFGRSDEVVVAREDEKCVSGDDRRNSLKVLVCGMAAGTVQSVFLCPMEHVKCRLQVDTHRRHRGAVDLCVSIIREHGVMGLNRGMGATIWREAPSFGVYFASYDVAKERVEGLLRKANGGIAVGGVGGDDGAIPSQAHAYAASALAGGISGALAWLVTYPFDVIKTQIQTSPMDGRYTRMGTWAVGHELVQRHGWRHLFRGLGITLVGAVPVNAVIFPTYEWVISQLEEE